MARMSIDDMAKRDPRFLMLVRLCGWSKRETWGAVTDVWEICYDRKTHVLPVVEINETILSGAPPGTPYDFGFADKMLACGLARRDRGIPKGSLSIVGAEKRIKYLLKSEETGRIGGLKSAQMRKAGKGKARDPQGSQESFNLIATVPDPVPDAAVDPDRVPDPEPDPGSGVSPTALSRDSASPPAEGNGSSGSNGTPSAQRPPALRVVTNMDELAADLAVLHVAAFERVRTKRSVDVPPIDSPRLAIRRLLVQLVADGLTEDDIKTKCFHLLTVREAEAHIKEKLEWFGERVWLNDNFKASQTRSLADITGKKPPRQPRQTAPRSVEESGPRPAAMSFAEYMKSIDDPKERAIAEATYAGIDYSGKENTS